MCLNTRLFTIIIYFVITQLFIMFLKYSDYIDTYLCFNCAEKDLLNVHFDYIIVGCGSAGAVVARRLAEDKNVKILVLEAGKQGSSFLNIPSLGLLLQKTPFDWQYETTPQTTSSFALNNNISHWPMGKIVGGTSMLNNMVHVRGHPADFARWFKDKEGYDYTTDVLPYFEKLDDNTRGSIHTSDLAFKSILPDFIQNAAKELNIPISDATSSQGFGTPKLSLHNGIRWTSAHRLLELNHPNVLLRTNRLVEKILLRENFEAYGVKYTYMGKSYTARATKGVILSAGVIGTAKILLLSGIGPKAHLNDVNITTKIDLPVGENLQDHVTTGFDLVLLNQTLGMGIERMLSPLSIFQYFWSGSGPWTTGGCEGLAFINRKNATINTDVPPDLQLMFMPLGINEDTGVYLRHLMGISDYTWDNYFAYLDGMKAMTILPVLLHPKSKGTVRLRDGNFESPPVIDPKYLREQEDVEVLLNGIDYIKKIINTTPMQKLGARLNTNVFPGCESFKFDSKPYWECYVRHLTITSYHPVGTCAMGQELAATTVVNYDFEVKNTNNLYVVDASVIPTTTSGNVNGAVLMLAEMASDVIKFKNFLRTGKSYCTEIFISRNYC